MSLLLYCVEPAPRLPGICSAHSLLRFPRLGWVPIAGEASPELRKARRLARTPTLLDSHRRSQRYKTRHGRVKSSHGGTYSIAPSESPPPAASTAAAAATSPPNPDAATATSAAAASAASVAASAASAAVAASPGNLYAGFRCSVFLVEDIESRQADISDLFFTESYFVASCGVLRRHIRCGHPGRRGAARQRQRQPGDS